MRQFWMLGVLVMVLALTAGSAQAENYVDWSAYIDHSAPKTPPTASTSTQSKAKSRTTRVTRQKKVAKAKVKARAKSKNARRK